MKDSRLKVEVEDREGLKHQLAGLSCSGRPHLKVKEGNLEYAIDFSAVRSIQVVGQEGQNLRLRLSFVNGTSKEYLIPANTYCRASSHVGEAGFYLKDIKAIFIKREEKTR